MRKRIFSTVMAVGMLCLCAGCCNKKSPDGEWTHTKTVWDDGSVMEANELEPESVAVNGETAHYSCDSSFLNKTIEFDLAVAKNDDGTYNFSIIGKDNTPSGIVFMENVEVNGDTMSYNMDGVEFVYTRK